jgi:hypothetical protein
MKIITTFIFLFSFFPLWGQHTLLYPEMFSGFFNHQALFNPSFQQDTGRIAVSASLKSRMGAFKNIATYYASLDRNFMNSRNSGHTIRFLFYNEKEGPYIEKPRGYFNYAFRIAMAEETFFSAGAAIGFTQIAFSAPSASATGIATMPDASIGLYLKRNFFKTGISSMQLLNSESSPASVLVKLGRYYNFFAETEKELGYSWKMKISFLYRLLPAYKDNIDLALRLSFKDALVVGASGRYRYGTSFFVSFNINAGNSLLCLNFAYNTPFLSGVTALNNSFEISPTYILK